LPLFIAVVAIPLFIIVPDSVNGQMMGGERMKGMRGMGMMQRMIGNRLPPGIDLKHLPEPQSKGARLLARYCAQCHNLPGPGMHTADEWPAVIKRMDSRMAMHSRMMGGIVVPGRSERVIIRNYLQAHAIKPIRPKDYADLNTPAGRAFRKTCVQCHALPDPKQHTPNEWPAVIGRMQKNMSAMKKPAPSGPMMVMIVKFLKRHGRTSQ
jgi:cytochrome c2